MSLPDLIEIVPLDKPVRAEITVPGSKSITNRALILAALAEGETTLEGALWSEDTQVMVECLQELGFMINVMPDQHEFCNRAITVYGMGGRVPRGGTPEQPLELFVGNAGTAARFLTALLCLGEGVYRLHGVPRMHERPQAALFRALRELGYQIDSTNERLPALIHGVGPRAGKCRVSIEESSQFASALLLCAKTGGWKVEVTGESAEESPYVAMTSKLIAAFPKFGTFQIEPDTSSGSYFLGASIVAPKFSSVAVANWPRTRWQMDEAFTNYLPPTKTVSRRTDLGDSIMTWSRKPRDEAWRRLKHPGSAKRVHSSSKKTGGLATSRPARLRSTLDRMLEGCQRRYRNSTPVRMSLRSRCQSSSRSDRASERHLGFCRLAFRPMREPWRLS